MTAPLQREEFAPASFRTAAHAGYLGSPEVVAGLLGRFLAESEADLEALARRGMDAEQFEDEARLRILALAHQLSGEDPAHPGVAGWHGASMQGAMRAALGPFLAKNGAKWGDDPDGPIACLLEWLLVTLAGAWKRAAGDDVLLAADLRPALARARDLLTGSAHPA